MDSNVVTIMYGSSKAETLSMFVSWDSEAGIAVITEAGYM